MQNICTHFVFNPVLVQGLVKLSRQSLASVRLGYLHEIQRYFDRLEVALEMRIECNKCAMVWSGPTVSGERDIAVVVLRSWVSHRN